MVCNDKIFVMYSDLGLSIVSFGITAALMVPFIGFLYRMKFTRKEETQEVRKTATAAFYKIREMHAGKVGVPTGGGILIGLVVSVLFGIMFFTRWGMPGFISAHPVTGEVAVIFLTFMGFGLLGFYDDVIKIFGFAKTGIFGLRMRHKFIVQWLLGIGAASILTFWLGIDFVFIPFFGILDLGWLYLPFAAFLIVAFANAFDITDGLDGLSCGLLMICLMGFWVISLTNIDSVMGTFIALWMGGLLAFLYFNVYPARIMLGNLGGMAFGATLAVIGLLSGKIVALLIIGGVFVAEGGSSLLQLFSKRFMKRRLFAIAPFHHLLQLKGWEEPKIVARMWLAGLILAIFGLWLALL